LRIFDARLGAQPAGHLRVREALDLGVTLLGDDEVKDGEVGADNAATDRFALALAALALAVAREALGEEEPHAGVGEHTLLHREALLIVAARDAEKVAGKLLAKGGAVNLLRDAHVVERAELALIVDVDVLLVARGRVRDVELGAPE